MCTVKPGTEVVENMISGYRQEGIFRFFEASSIRKIEDKYVFIYSRTTAEGEDGLPNASNYTLAYGFIASILWVPGPMAEQSSMPVRASMMKKAM